MKQSLRTIAESHESNRVFAVAVRKNTISPQDPIEYAFEQIASRFDYYLQRLHRNGDTQRGIIVFDKATYETTVQSLATDFKTVGHTWGVIRNLAEVPLFLESKASRLIQVADIIAYAVFRCFEHNDDSFFSIIEKRFDAVGGVIHGLHVRQ